VRNLAPALVLVFLSCLPAPGHAAELLLPPGASVTIVDAADPAMRIVLTSPPDAPLDLTPLLSLKPEESVRAIVTHIQAKAASGLAMNPDGSISLSAPVPGPATRATPGLAGGLLIREGAQWTLRHGAAVPASSTTAPPLAPPGPKATIYKSGVTRDEAERDIAQCRSRAEQAAVQMLKPADKVSTYNSSMFGCLRGLGYDIRS
jgi:hypothetical protein